MIEIPDEQIALDSDFASRYGFTRENFYQDTYLVGNSSLKHVIVPMVLSNHLGEGHFSKAEKMLLRDSNRISIPTPVPIKQEILEVWGFEIIWNTGEGIEYWIYPPYAATVK